LLPVARLTASCLTATQVIEAGFEIDLQTLRQVGGRAVGASIVGMLLGAGPLAFGVAKGLGLKTTEALAVGASLAPCSTGVALVVLKRKRCGDRLSRASLPCHLLTRALLLGFTPER
jgi:Kef-type K+ transport system membrane component KefB